MFSNLTTRQEHLKCKSIRNYPHARREMAPKPTAGSFSRSCTHLEERMVAFLLSLAIPSILHLKVTSVFIPLVLKYTTAAVCWAASAASTGTACTDPAVTISYSIGSLYMVQHALSSKGRGEPGKDSRDDRRTHSRSVA